MFLLGEVLQQRRLIPPTSGGSGGIPIRQKEEETTHSIIPTWNCFSVFCVKIFVNFLVVAVELYLTCLFVFSVFLFSDWTPVELLPGQTTLGENNVERKSGGI